MPRRKKALEIDLADLANALDDHSGLAWYLDTKTGDVVPVPDDLDDDLLPVPRDELVDSERFVFVEPIESGFGWGEMRDFAGRVADQRLRGLLEVALAGKGAFSRFRAVLANHPQERAEWFAGHDRWVEEQARVWLDRQDIQWSPRKAATAKRDQAGPPRVSPRSKVEAAAPGPQPNCELCSGKDHDSHWVEVVPEREGISLVTVDVTLRLCPDHRARLLRAVNREDADSLEPPKHEGMGWGTSPNGRGK
jgi:hypothetical protein